MPTPAPWLTGEREYEGFPLLLRHPAGLDYDLLPAKWLAVTHLLDRTLPNGLPEPDYNDTLADFDDDVCRYLSTLDQGKIVLIETFGHQRSYYAYCASDVSLETVKEYFANRYPNFRLEYFEKNDPNAAFIRKYAAELF
jgi:hypothetical protein